MSERAYRLKSSKGESSPKTPFDITKYVNPISIGSVISLISLGLYYKYKSDAWEYENLMKAKPCNSIDEALQSSGQYVNFVCEANADKLFVSKKLVDGMPQKAIVVMKESIMKIRNKNDLSTEDQITDQSILSGPIILTNKTKRIKVEAKEYLIDDDKGLSLDHIVYQERMLPKKFRKALKDPLAAKIYDSEKVLWPGTPLTAFGVIQKTDGKYEFVKEKSKPYYLTTKTTEDVIAKANENVHPNLFWSAVGTGSFGLCILTAGIIKSYLSK